MADEADSRRGRPYPGGRSGAPAPFDPAQFEVEQYGQDSSDSAEEPEFPDLHYRTNDFPTAPTMIIGPMDPETGRATLIPAPVPRPLPLIGDGGARGPSLVRPYARTGGRTAPGRDLNLEALVVPTREGREARSSPLLSPEHHSVLDLCMGTVSVAEIAAQLSVPLGVARVIIADMVGLGLVEVMKTSASIGEERDPAFLRRVLSGLQRL